MVHLENRRLKVRLATEFAHAIGFKGLCDFKTIIGKSELVAGIPFLRKNKEVILQTFKGYCRVQLRREIRVNSVIKIFRSMIKDAAIQGAVHTRKINFYLENGRPSSCYCYKLLR